MQCPVGSSCNRSAREIQNQELHSDWPTQLSRPNVINRRGNCEGNFPLEEREFTAQADEGIKLLLLLSPFHLSPKGLFLSAPDDGLRRPYLQPKRSFHAGSTRPAEASRGAPSVRREGRAAAAPPLPGLRGAGDAAERYPGRCRSRKRPCASRSLLGESNKNARETRPRPVSDGTLSSLRLTKSPRFPNVHRAEHPEPDRSTLPSQRLWYQNRKWAWLPAGDPREGRRPAVLPRPRCSPSQPAPLFSHAGRWKRGSPFSFGLRFRLGLARGLGLPCGQRGPNRSRALLESGGGRVASACPVFVGWGGSSFHAASQEGRGIILRGRGRRHPEALTPLFPFVALGPRCARSSRLV